MAIRPAEPPPYLRTDLTATERAAIVAVVGPLDDALVHPIRDGRGRVFQRLEFLGDSVLDLVMMVHAVVEPACPRCTSVGGDVAKLVTDQRLAKQAAASGLGSWLEWEPSHERLADLVEACAASAWLAGRWPQVTTFAAAFVHPLGPAVAAALASSPEHDSSSAPRIKVERRMGASLFELAAGYRLFTDHPDVDEGELSRLRALNHRATRIAAFARHHHLFAEAAADHPGSPLTTPDDSVVSDQVEAMLAERLLQHGADAALATADEVLR